NVDDLKNLIYAHPRSGIAADELIDLWKVSIPVVAATKHNAVRIKTVDDKEELLPTDELLDFFGDAPAKKTVHVIVTRPPRGKAFVTTIKQIHLCDYTHD
ncbi:hypothetical protein BGX21_007712, partial [Mortierella sp. AD011]